MNNSEILVSLDVGTSKIKVIIGEVFPDSLNIIGVGTAKSKGLKKAPSLISIRPSNQSGMQWSRPSGW